MSRHTPCNYCNLERIKQERPGQTILLKATNDRFPIDGDTGPFLPELIAVTAETLNGHTEHIALMDTIPSRCAC